MFKRKGLRLVQFTKANGELEYAVEELSFRANGGKSWVVVFRSTSLEKAQIWKEENMLNYAVKKEVIE